MDPDHSDQAPASTQVHEIQRLLAGFTDVPGGLLPALHAIQRQVGYVPADAVPAIAQAFNLSRAEVHGVISFYHFFRQKPAGKKVVYVCRAEACQAMGARDLERHLRETLKVDWHETTSDGRYTLEPVYCLGNCACAPAMMIDETLHGRVSADRADELLG